MAKKKTAKKPKPAPQIVESIPQELLGPAEAAAELGVTVRRVTKLCQQQRLGRRVGDKMWVISRTELDEFKKVPRRPGPRPGVRRAFKKTAT